MVPCGNTLIGRQALQGALLVENQTVTRKANLMLLAQCRTAQPIIGGVGNQPEMDAPRRDPHALGSHSIAKKRRSTDDWAFSAAHTGSRSKKLPVAPGSL